MYTTSIVWKYSKIFANSVNYKTHIVRSTHIPSNYHNNFGYFFLFVCVNICCRVLIFLCFLSTREHKTLSENVKVKITNGNIFNFISYLWYWLVDSFRFLCVSCDSHSLLLIFFSKYLDCLSRRSKRIVEKTS